jgi:hypothetical protein
VPCFYGSNHISVAAIKSGNTARDLQNFAKPDRSQLDAVLAAVKAWPGEAGACVADSATASLDGICARRHRAGRSGRRNAYGRTKKREEGLVSLFDLKSPFLRPDP